ncbi:hypothetical protein AB0K05_24990 [Nonomuraea sp. NPDC049486]|uniref:hypothetical protein n=1 Tax=Nonomuraea sp. NPDC049486 TaxID=3155773 RepID=UPI003421A750
MRTKILAAAAVSTLTLLAASAASATAASAALDIASLDITAINYNSYGADSVDNNTEYVEVKASADVNVAGLLVQDAWAKGRDKTRGCNTARIAPGTLPVAADATPDVLPAGAVLRVHMGKGTPGIDRQGVRHVYRAMPAVCGYKSNVFNNSGPAGNRYADWDRVWVTLGDQVESKGYNFSFGYVAK